MTTRLAPGMCWRLASVAVAASVIAGCAARGPHNQQSVRGGEVAADLSAKTEAAANSGQVRAPKESLETFIQRTRALAAKAHPQDQLRNLESEDSDLAAARLLLEVRANAENQRRVALAYMKRGVLDAAYDHFKAALKLDSSDATSYDGLARVWRDWGLPHLGLGDAHRAIYHAPSSPAVYNTLGTILQRLGQNLNAQRAFEAALQRDPKASYALNNLCYVKFLQGFFADAIAACRTAISLQPDLAAAQNNLGLAYWAEGDGKASAEAFASVGEPAAARYNVGITLLGSRQYWKAAQAFDDASSLGPVLKGGADKRARQARTLAVGAVESQDGSHGH